MLSLKELNEACSSCRKCPLGETRTNMVFGEGNIKAKLVFIGEAPGYEEDMSGRPFVGKAGQLLDTALSALDLKRDRDYYICNILKCRPPKNRTPLEEEAKECLPYLRNQIAIMRPKIIVALGATSLKYVIGDEYRITRDRGKWIERKGFYMTATFHPSAVLRDESKKRPFWEDLKEINRKYRELLRY